MTTIFASDFHGTGDAYINKIMYMFHKHPEAQIVFGGDYIDGRKQIKQVLNFVRQMQLILTKSRMQLILLSLMQAHVKSTLAIISF